MMLNFKRKPTAPQPPQLERTGPDGSAIIRDLAHRASSMGKEAAELLGVLDDVAAVARRQDDAFKQVAGDVRQMVEANRAIATATTTSRDSAKLARAAVDRNGYLPTHNLKFSRPQRADPVWNAANCRNRRIFNDRTGLAAGRNTRKFLLQTYHRDMGGGRYVLMKDLAAPIFVNGRHRGGLRMGCQF